MVASTAVLFHICIRLLFLLLAVLDLKFFSAQREKYKEIRRKKEEEKHQIRIHFKSVYSAPQTLQLNLARFFCVRFATLVSANPKIIFLYYPCHGTIFKEQINQ